ncbi:MAG: hypothetical protein J3Q66DRAFT_354683, partial [Benniella sp.]
LSPCLLLPPLASALSSCRADTSLLKASPTVKARVVHAMTWSPFLPLFYHMYLDPHFCLSRSTRTTRTTGTTRLTRSTRSAGTSGHQRKQKNRSVTSPPSSRERHGQEHCA